MPTRTAPPGRDMTHVWAGRSRKARERRIVAGLAEMLTAGWTVDPDGSVRDDRGTVKARIRLT
jgi:hypothetical protein